VVHVDHGLALAAPLEDVAHLVHDHAEVATVERAQHPDDPHVLPALRVVSDL
jgi:hypothetical protein